MELPLKAIELQIDRGAILHSTMFKNIDHGKFFVIIGVNKDFVAGFFFINSNINRSLWNKKEQIDMQYPMKHSDYPFLKYDSFLCATDIVKLSRKRISESVNRGETKFIGNMKQEHVNDVLEIARDSRLFSKIDKMQFFYE